MSPLLAAVVAWVIAVAGIGLMTAAGRSRPAGPSEPASTQVIDYGGVVRAANGPLPPILWAVFAAVAGFAILFVIAVVAGWYVY